MAHVALIALLALTAPPKAFREAEQLFAKGKYAEAGRRFEEAFEQTPDHAYLYNAAFAYEKEGDAVEALRVYEKFVVFTTNPDRRAQVEAKVRELDTALAKTHARLQISVDPAGAFVFVDDDPKPVEAPFDRRLPAGRHELSIRKPGFNTRVEFVEVVAGEPRKVKIALRPAGEAPVEEPIAAPTPISGPAVAPADSGSIVRKWWFWTAIGVVVAGGVTATVLLWPADSETDAPTGGTWKVDGGQ